MHHISNSAEVTFQDLYQQNNVVANNQYITNSKTKTVDTSISNRSTTAIRSNLSFAYFKKLCESNDIEHVAKELTKIQQTYDYNQYKEWILTKITVVTKVVNLYNSNYVDRYYGDDYDNYDDDSETIDISMSPIQYAVEEKNFNLATQLINIADLKQQQHDSSNFIHLLLQEYQVAIEEVQKSNYRKVYDIKCIMESLVKVYINNNINILELMPIFVNAFRYDKHNIFYLALYEALIAKIENNCQDEIKLFYENISNNNKIYKTQKNEIFESIFYIALNYQVTDLLLIMLESNSELFFANNSYLIKNMIRKINDYGVMKKCLEYLVKTFTYKFIASMYGCSSLKLENITDFGKGDYYSPCIDLLNFCIIHKYNESALAIIVHGVNIKFNGNENDSNRNHEVQNYYPSQLALIMAIKSNNINMLKILVGLNAKQCDTDVILNSSVLKSLIEPLKSIENREEIKNILDNPLKLKEVTSIKAAYNLLQKINKQSNINLASIKQYIKEYDLLPPACVNRIQSIEDLFLPDA